MFVILRVLSNKTNLIFISTVTLKRTSRLLNKGRPEQVPLERNLITFSIILSTRKA